MHKIMKPVLVRFQMPENAMALIASLLSQVSNDNQDCLVMLQVRENGDTDGFWLPKELSDKAFELGKEIVAEYKK